MTMKINCIHDPHEEARRRGLDQAFDDLERAKKLTATPGREEEGQRAYGAAHNRVEGHLGNRCSF